MALQRALASCRWCYSSPLTCCRRSERIRSLSKRRRASECPLWHQPSLTEPPSALRPQCTAINDGQGLRPEIRPYRYCFQSCFGCFHAPFAPSCAFKMGAAHPAYACASYSVGPFPKCLAPALWPQLVRERARGTFDFSNVRLPECRGQEFSFGRGRFPHAGAICPPRPHVQFPPTADALVVRRHALHHQRV